MILNISAAYNQNHLFVFSDALQSQSRQGSVFPSFDKINGVSANGFSKHKFGHILCQSAKTQYPGITEEEEKNKEERNGKWGKGAPEPKEQKVKTPTNITIKGILASLMESVNEEDKGKVISLGMGDPTAHACFRTTPVAEEGVIDFLQSQKFNGYAPTVGLPGTRRAIAEYLSRDLPYKLSPDDVYVTSGCTQAIDVALSTVARPGSNILLPRPGFPIYDLCSSFRNLEVRHFDLLPSKGWEVDLGALEALADQNTAAIVIINPGNPCANVYSYQHLEKIAETAKMLGIPVIADEVYGHLAFGSKPFVPMGVFGSSVPVLTLGSLSKRWIVPGWRLGWFVTSDPNGMFKTSKVVERLKKYFDILGGPATFIQAAVPQIIEQTDEDFFSKTINILKHSSDICCDMIKDIPGITCPRKPEGSMAVMAKLDVSLFGDISDDIDFCFKLAKEEAVVVLPGITVGLKNWIRITFAVDSKAIEEGLGRIKAFCQRHNCSLQDKIIN